MEEGITSSICEASDGGDEDVNMGKLDHVGLLVALVSYIVFYIIILTISICKQYCQVFRWNKIFFT